MTGESVASEPAAAWCGGREAPGAKHKTHNNNTVSQSVPTLQRKLGASGSQLSFKSTCCTRIFGKHICTDALPLIPLCLT